jgi:hypothetical protein
MKPNNKDLDYLRKRIVKKLSNNEERMHRIGTLSKIDVSSDLF